MLRRRQILLGAGAAAMTSFVESPSAQPSPWSPISPAEAGFAPDLDARLDQAVVNKRVWNLRGLVVLRDGRLVLERYFEGEDRVRGVGDIGHVKFAPHTLHDLRSCSKGIVGLLYGIALHQGKVPAPDAPLFTSFPE
jgi:CubicO group peptidase (beta-lactamase class C family)